MEACVRTAVTARVQNNGQSCIAAKRFIVVDEVADEFLERFVAAMDALVVGDPFEPQTDIGPIVTEAQRDELVSQVAAAVAQGATVHAGASVPDGDGWWFAPTVLSGVTVDMPVAQEEIFGPVALVLRVPDLDRAILAANSTTFGLGSSVWTDDQGEARRCVEEIEAGAVFVNAMVASTAELPFGGIKRSGYGRELSELGLKEFTNPKTVWIA
jgi:succinate-semialdehyde dehydrogenase/glutarate-semialdehyde dehydrogenase